MQEELRVRQLIRDRQEVNKEKNFVKAKKEETKERQQEFQKIELTREEAYTKTQKHYKTLDNVAHQAGKDHIREVESSIEAKIKQVEQEAQSSHNRFVRDETKTMHRRVSLQ